MEAHATSDARWSVSPETERLKALAKRAGLWNLWLPADSRVLLKINARRAPKARSCRAPALSNLEYAHLAAEMGQSVWASEFFNCSAPDAGNI